MQAQYPCSAIKCPACGLLADFNRGDNNGAYLYKCLIARGSCYKNCMNTYIWLIQRSCEGILYPDRCRAVQFPGRSNEDILRRDCGTLQNKLRAPEYCLETTRNSRDKRVRVRLRAIKENRGNIGGIASNWLIEQAPLDGTAVVIDKTTIRKPATYPGAPAQLHLSSRCYKDLL